MARIAVSGGLTLQCDVDDFLWPWDTATPVLMMHGFARTADFWRRWIPYVAAKHRIYRPELRGFGRSDAPPDDYAYTTENVVDDLLRVFEQCGLERVHWVGESSGGLLGLTFAALRPERVASVVVCDSPVRIPDAIKKAYALDEASSSAAIRKYGIREWSRRTLGDGGRLDTRRASPELQTWVLDEMDKSANHAAANILAYFESCDLTPLLPTIQAPVLILGGEDSAVASETRAKMASLLPNARLKTFPGYSHGINLLAPEECTAAALAFWRDIS